MHFFFRLTEASLRIRVSVESEGVGRRVTTISIDTVDSTQETVATGTTDTVVHCGILNQKEENNAK